MSEKAGSSMDLRDRREADKEKFKRILHNALETIRMCTSMTEGEIQYSLVQNTHEISEKALHLTQCLGTNMRERTIKLLGDALIMVILDIGQGIRGDNRRSFTTKSNIVDQKAQRCTVRFTRTRDAVMDCLQTMDHEQAYNILHDYFSDMTLPIIKIKMDSGNMNSNQISQLILFEAPFKDGWQKENPEFVPCDGIAVQYYHIMLWFSYCVQTEDIADISFDYLPPYDRTEIGKYIAGCADVYNASPLANLNGADNPSQHTGRFNTQILSPAQKFYLSLFTNTIGSEELKCCKVHPEQRWRNLTEEDIYNIIFEDNGDFPTLVRDEAILIGWIAKRYMNTIEEPFDLCQYFRFIKRRFDLEQD